MPREFNPRVRYGLRRRIGPRAWSFVWSLAAAQLVSWGSLYYAFAVFVVPMERDLGWSKTELNGALSLGLLISGLCALPIGRWIDRRGGHGVMTIGSISGGALLAAWAFVDDLWLFYAVWVGLGIVLAAVLYEPAFAVVTAKFGTNYRKAITVLTLVGGLASTVFIPLTQWLIDLVGWRPALLMLGTSNVLICGTIHGVMLRRTQPRPPAETSPAADLDRRISPLRKMLASRRFWGLLVCFTAYGMTFSALTFHIIPLLAERGVETAAIIACVAAIGPMQVAGRMVLLFFGPKLTTRQAGIFVTVTLPASILGLIVLPPTLPWLIVFAGVYGAGNGVMTIVRGTAVPDLLTKEAYGTINGALSLISTIARAVAPFAAAAVWSYAGGYDAVLWMIFAGACLAAISFWVAARGG